MTIEQLSSNIDQKLAQLESKLAALKAQEASGVGDIAQIKRDQVSLLQIKNKLEKSRAIMWQAYELKQGGLDRKLKQRRMIGLIFCVVSGLGLLAIGAILIFR